MAIDKKEYKILVIEDNPGDFALVEDFLFEYIVAPEVTQILTFRSAGEILAEKQFDIILLDLSLPDKTGEQLIKDIVALGRGAPVIVLTGYSDFSFGIRSLSLGVSDYILKDELTAMSLYKSIIYSLERKKNIADLKESEKRYSDLFNLSPLPMWVVDLETLKFLDVNAATISHYGFGREELLSMTLQDIRPEEEIPSLLKGIAEDRDAQRSHSSRLVVHKKKNGEIRNVQIEIAQIQYKGQKANVVVATDITERLNYIKAIEEQNERLREISWMQSHLVRAPLTRILGLVHLLTFEEEIKDEKEEILGYIVRSANELDDIVKTITERSKIEDVQAERLEVV